LNLSRDRIRETLSAGSIFSLKDHLEKHECDIIEVALEMCGGNTAEAAKQMALKRTTLIAKIHKYNIGETQ
jgi:sigma-54 specific flagellar transcriptional regulator A